MMAKPMKTLELHYPMIQSLIKLNNITPGGRGYIGLCEISDESDIISEELVILNNHISQYISPALQLA